MKKIKDGMFLSFQENRYVIYYRKGGSNMAVDLLQEKIRKRKNPIILQLSMPLGAVPDKFRENADSAQAYGAYCRELLETFKDTIPAVRVSSSMFVLQGPSGLKELHRTLDFAAECGYYVLLDAPELLFPDAASAAAEALLGDNATFTCDGLIIPGYSGSDIIKPFIPYCKKGKKDIYVVVRTANKSASEIQDLLAGGRLVHYAAADHVNRYGSDTQGKYGYTQIGIMAAASAADSLRGMRMKYPELFFILDGYDYPNANAKNCANAFDKFGHGAAVCSGNSIACAWQREQDGSIDYLKAAKDAVDRMKKNLARYISVL